jgi:nucleotide-binding universal stress UspA family protein
MAFKNILVPHDFDTVSDNALDNAIEIAKLVKDSNITILHVVQDIAFPSTRRLDSKPIYSIKTGEVVTPSVYVKELHHEIRLEALKKLENKKQKCKKEGILCENRVVNGNSKEQIIKYIQEQKIDLVVMGTARRKGISKFITIGSVTRNVSERSSCPVMLVH